MVTINLTKPLAAGLLIATGLLATPNASALCDLDVPGDCLNGFVPRYALIPGETIAESRIAAICDGSQDIELWSFTRWYILGYYDEDGDWNEEYRDPLFGYETRPGLPC